MPNLPMIHIREWRKLEPLLPPSVGRPGKPRLEDRMRPWSLLAPSVPGPGA